MEENKRNSSEKKRPYLKENDNSSKRKKFENKNFNQNSPIEIEVNIKLDERIIPLNFHKTKLKDIRPDLIHYISKFINLSDVIYLLNVDKRMRLVILNKVKILTNYISFRRLLKQNKIEKEVQLFNYNNSELLPKFLDNPIFSSEDKQSLLYSILKLVSKSESINLEYYRECTYYYFSKLLTSDFSVCKKLNFIPIFRNEDNLNNFCSILKESQSIEELSLKNSNFEYDFFSSIFDSLELNKNIKVLNISKFPSWNEINPTDVVNTLKLLGVIERSTTIQNFEFNLGLITNNSQKYNAFTSMMENNKSVKNMKIRYYYPNARFYEFSYLRKNETIEILDLSRCPLKVTALKSLYANLSILSDYDYTHNLSKIHTLILQKIDIDSSKSLEYIGLLINSNSNIKKLDLSHNNLSKGRLLPLSKALEKNLSIKILLLQECNFDQDQLNILMESLKINQFLEELDLSFSKRYINLSGKVSEMLNYNFTLKKIGMQGIYNNEEENKVEEILKSRQDVNPVLQE